MLSSSESGATATDSPISGKSVDVTIQPKRIPKPAATFEAAVACHREGRLSEAERLYLAVLKANRDHFGSLHHLGILRAQQGRLDEAIRLIRRALKNDPNSAETWSDLGVALEKAHRPEEAIAPYRKALALKPGYAEAHYNLGNALQKLEHHQEAIAQYENALALEPRHVQARNNLGNSLHKLKRDEEAAACFEQALSLQPDYAEARNNLGTALHALNRPEQAIAQYKRALALRPDYAEAHYNLGNALHALNRHEDAIARYSRALAIKPNYAEVHNNLGNTFAALKHHHQAVLHLEKAVALKADYAEAHYNLGLALTGLQRLDQSIASFRRALELKPDQPCAFSGLVDRLRMICDWRVSAEMEQELLERVRTARSVEAPFVLLASSSRSDDQLRCAQQLIKYQLPDLPRPLWQGKSHSYGKLRLGYLSANFHGHPVAQLMAELFEQHDRAKFEVLAFSFGPADRGDVRRRLERAFDRFLDVRQLGEAEIARRIHELEIDVAIDLMGYTEDNRLGIFAHRPAPVQASYLGYAGTTGADFIDYIIVDPFVVPADQQPFFAEKLVHLPDCYMVNDSTRPIPDATPSRAECGLPQRGFVFCCFSNAYKISPICFDIWMRLLTAVPDSVLWLRHYNDWAERNLRGEAQARGVDPARLIFAPRVPPEQHLARHRRADLFLDTLPYNAHATASDALWAGLPVLTCVGWTFAGRVGGGLLQAIGLPELVTSTAADYEQLALKLAREPPLLQEIRAKLERNRRTKPLFDTHRFRRHIEAAYLEMLEIARRGERPRALTIAPVPDDDDASGAGDRLRG